MSRHSSRVSTNQYPHNKYCFVRGIRFKLQRTPFKRHDSYSVFFIHISPYNTTCIPPSQLSQSISLLHYLREIAFHCVAPFVLSGLIYYPAAAGFQYGMDQCQLMKSQPSYRRLGTKKGGTDNDRLVLRSGSLFRSLHLSCVLRALVMATNDYDYDYDYNYDYDYDSVSGIDAQSARRVIDTCTICYGTPSSSAVVHRDFNVRIAE